MKFKYMAFAHESDHFELLSVPNQNTYIGLPIKPGIFVTTKSLFPNKWRTYVHRWNKDIIYSHHFLYKTGNPLLFYERI